MVGVESDHRETQRRLGRAGQGTNVRDHEVGTHAFTRDLCPSAFPRRFIMGASRLPDSSWTNRRSAASRMLACPLAFALDVKTTADGQSYVRIDAE